MFKATQCMLYHYHCLHFQCGNKSKVQSQINIVLPARSSLCGAINLALAFNPLNDDLWHRKKNFRAVKISIWPPVLLDREANLKRIKMLLLRETGLVPYSDLNLYTIDCTPCKTQGPLKSGSF